MHLVALWNVRHLQLELFRAGDKRVLVLVVLNACVIVTHIDVGPLVVLQTPLGRRLHRALALLQCLAGEC